VRPNDIGEALERKAARLLSGARIVQSGGGKFIKLDVKDAGSFIYSCKATGKLGDAAARGIWKLWLEAYRGAIGPAGHGTNAKAAIIFEIQGEAFVLTRLEDHADLATREAEPYIPTTKVQERRAKALRNPLYDTRP